MKDFIDYVKYGFGVALGIAAGYMVYEKMRDYIETKEMERKQTEHDWEKKVDEFEEACK